MNETLRRGLSTRPGATPKSRFKVVTRDLGRLRPGLSLDNVADLIEQVEGARHR